MSSGLAHQIPLRSSILADPLHQARRFAVNRSAGLSVRLDTEARPL